MIRGFVTMRTYPTVTAVGSPTVSVPLKAASSHAFAAMWWRVAESVA
jgi:hypothetical protein